MQLPEILAGPVAETGKKRKFAAPGEVIDVSCEDPEEDEVPVSDKHMCWLWLVTHVHQREGWLWEIWSIAPKRTWGRDGR